MNLSEERMEEMEEHKAVLKNKNLDAVASLLLEMRDQNKKVLEDNVDLRRMVTNATQRISELQGEIDALKVMGFRGNMGTGSTVHNAGE